MNFPPIVQVNTQIPSALDRYYERQQMREQTKVREHAMAVADSELALRSQEVQQREQLLKQKADEVARTDKEQRDKANSLEIFSVLRNAPKTPDGKVDRNALLQDLGPILSRQGGEHHAEEIADMMEHNEAATVDLVGFHAMGDKYKPEKAEKAEERKTLTDPAGIPRYTDTKEPVFPGVEKPPKDREVRNDANGIPRYLDDQSPAFPGIDKAPKPTAGEQNYNRKYAAYLEQTGDPDLAKKLALGAIKVVPNAQGEPVYVDVVEEAKARKTGPEQPPSDAPAEEPMTLWDAAEGSGIAGAVVEGANVVAGNTPIGLVSPENTRQRTALDVGAESWVEGAIKSVAKGQKEQERLRGIFSGAAWDKPKPRLREQMRQIDQELHVTASSLQQELGNPKTALARKGVIRTQLRNIQKLIGRLGVPPPGEDPAVQAILSRYPELQDAK